MTKQEKLKELFENMTKSELVAIWNYYCSINYCNDYIYDMDELDELLQNDKPTKIANKIFYGEFSPIADYFTFNGYGNLQSIFSYELLEYIYINDLIDYVIENDENFENDEIDEILQNDKFDE